MEKPLSDLAGSAGHPVMVLRHALTFGSLEGQGMCVGPPASVTSGYDSHSRVDVKRGPLGLRQGLAAQFTSKPPASRLYHCLPSSRAGAPSPNSVTAPWLILSGLSS